MGMMIVFSNANLEQKLSTQKEQTEESDVNGRFHLWRSMDTGFKILKCLRNGKSERKTKMKQVGKHT